MHAHAKMQAGTTMLCIRGEQYEWQGLQAATKAQKKEMEVGLEQQEA
jgi:beta-lactamase superfamily II metal-dependent hydrolase